MARYKLEIVRKKVANKIVLLKIFNKTAVERT